MVRATRGYHHCLILIHYRPTQTCFVNGRCRHTRFSLGCIDVRAPEEGSNGYIVGNKNLSQAWGTDAQDPIFYDLLKGPIESILAVQHLRPGDAARDVHRGLELLFRFLGMMDYFLHLLLLSPAMHLGRHTDLANGNVYVYICGFRYKNGRG